MARDIQIEIHLPYRPDVVWQALTDPQQLSQWLMPVEDFSPVVGCRFRLRARPMPGWDGVVHCEVLDVEEGRLLPGHLANQRDRDHIVHSDRAPE